MAQLLDRLRQIALETGMPGRQCWDMTLPELERYIRAYNRQTENRMRERAAMDYQHARLISVMISAALSGADCPTLAEAYPALFEPEPQTDSVQRFMLYAAQHNARMEETA